jgi:ribosome-associated protein
MLRITSSVWLDSNEIQFSFIRSPGPGGQNVNKLATAVLLRFNIAKSSLPETVKARLIQVLAHRLTNQGDILIKATRFRTQERNKDDVIERLIVLLHKAAIPPKTRRKTKPTRSSVEKRLEHKKKHSKRKVLRGRVT